MGQGRVEGGEGRGKPGWEAPWVGAYKREWWRRLSVHLRACAGIFVHFTNNQVMSCAMY